MLIVRLYVEFLIKSMAKHMKYVLKMSYTALKTFILIRFFKKVGVFFF
jgi:hypothetical protein